MSAFVDSMCAIAKKDLKTLVLPEGNDERTLEAVQTILSKGFAKVVVLGNEEQIQASGYNLEGALLIDNTTSEHRERYADALCELRKSKGMTPEEALEKMDDPLYFGTVMVKMGEADGMVAGACHSTSDVLRAALQVVKTAPDSNYVSSFFLMNVPNCAFGHEGTFIFSDCGLNVQPTAEVLAETAVWSARSWEAFVGTQPYVAMLSHSTMGSAAPSEDREKVIEAVRLAKELDPSLALDGEMQLDAAIVPAVGSSKAPSSPVAGKANVLIFPDLDAGNIGYKLVQRLANAEAYGPITQGLAAPVNDLSRGCSAEDIVGVAAITCVQAQNRK